MLFRFPDIVAHKLTQLQVQAAIFFVLVPPGLQAPTFDEQSCNAMSTAAARAQGEVMGVVLCMDIA